VFSNGTRIASMELVGLAQRPVLENAEPKTLALDASHVYGTSCLGTTRGMWRVAVASGAVEQISGECTEHITVDDQFVYSLRFDAGPILVRTSKRGGATEVVWGFGGLTYAVRDGFAYGSEAGHIARVPAAGGPAVPLGDSSGFVRGIAVDDTTLYWFEDNAETTLHRIPLP
jgi:hypothetical protein